MPVFHSGGLEVVKPKFDNDCDRLAAVAVAFAGPRVFDGTDFDLDRRGPPDDVDVVWWVTVARRFETEDDLPDATF